MTAATRARARAIAVMRVPLCRGALSWRGSFEGEPDGHRALADGRGDSFGRAAADIADGEDARPIGLQRQGHRSVRTAGCGQRTGPGPNESVVVKVNQAAQPVCARYSPDEDEERARRKDAPRAGRAVGDGDRLKHLVAVQFPHLAVQHDVNVREPRDLIDEVARHVLAQVVLADYERDAGGVRGKEDRRLTDRVAAPDDRDRVTVAHQRLSLRRRVVDTHLLEIDQARDVEPTVPGARG